MTGLVRSYRILPLSQHYTFGNLWEYVLTKHVNVLKQWHLLSDWNWNSYGDSLLAIPSSTVHYSMLGHAAVILFSRSDEREEGRRVKNFEISLHTTIELYRTTEWVGKLINHCITYFTIFYEANYKYAWRILCKWSTPDVCKGSHILFTYNARYSTLSESFLL